jgi:hypothetical protein
MWLSRDHRERLSRKFSRLKNGHRIALTFDYIPHRRRHILSFPQPARAAVPVDPALRGSGSGSRNVRKAG